MKPRRRISQVTLLKLVGLFHLLLIFAAAPVLAQEKADDLVELRNTWRQTEADLLSDGRCSSLSLMRALAEGFMSRHGDASYAQTYNAYQLRYPCNETKLELLPSAFAAPTQPNVKGVNGICLTMSDILQISTNGRLAKRCGDTYIDIRAHR